MRLVEVNPTEIPNLRDARRGRVSYPILKSFLEGGHVCDMLDRTGMTRSLTGLSAGLSAYIKSHDMPIKLFVREGELYLLRLDLNLDGTPNPEYVPSLNGVRSAQPLMDDDFESLEVVDAAAVTSKRPKTNGGS